MPLSRMHSVDEHRRQTDSVKYPVLMFVALSIMQIVLLRLQSMRFQRIW